MNHADYNIPKIIKELDYEGFFKELCTVYPEHQTLGEEINGWCVFEVFRHFIFRDLWPRDINVTVEDINNLLDILVDTGCLTDEKTNPGQLDNHYLIVYNKTK